MYYCHLQADRGRAPCRLHCFGTSSFSNNFTNFSPNVKVNKNAPPMSVFCFCLYNPCTVFVLFCFFFLLQKATAAPSEGGKRRGRPKKEVRVLGQTLHCQCSHLFKHSLSPIELWLVWVSAGQNCISPNSLVLLLLWDESFLLVTAILVLVCSFGAAPRSHKVSGLTEPHTHRAALQFFFPSFPNGIADSRTLLFSFLFFASSLSLFATVKPSCQTEHGLSKKACLIWEEIAVL